MEKQQTSHDDLLEIQKHIAIMLADMGDAVIYTDVKGNITFLNFVAEELTGWAFKDALLKPVTEILRMISEDTREEVENQVTKILESAKMGKLANNPILIKKDGSEISIDEIVSPVKDKDENMTGLIFIFRDVSERKRLEAEIKSISRFPSDNPNPILRINKDGVLLYANEASKTLLKTWNCSVNNYIPEPWLDLIYKAKPHADFEIDCNGIVYLFNVNPITDSGYIHLYGKNITVRKESERKMIDAKIQAESATKIAEEAKNKAEKATLIAEDAVKAKQQFLSNMSHEIRTPMNAIIGFIRVLLKSDLTIKQKEYLNAIKISGDALIVLINDILDLAKVDAGKMTYEKIPFKMESSISAMLLLFDIKIKEKNLELVKEYDHNIPEVLVGDSIRLHQIILNLLSNAVKFTTKGKIIVSIRLLNEDAEKATVILSVSDSGIGIPENMIEHIFKNFQQGSNETSRLYGGTGLGLSIVKQLVEQQGGTISVKSRINEGTTFSIILSFQKTKEEVKSVTDNLELNAEIKSIKILVVEDVELNQLLMKTILSDFGFEHDIAGNGKIAIEKLKTKTYDIILMDLLMPEMNGFEATEHIRNKMNSNIPILALTADVTTVDVAKCKTVGMNDYIPKPIDEKILYHKIVALVNKFE